MLWISSSVLFARALEEETCLMGNDGSCLPKDLPPVVDEYIDVGFGDKQQVTGTQETIEATMKQLQEMVHYMQGIVMTDPSFADVKHECGNRNELCVYWVSQKQQNVFLLSGRAPNSYIHIYIYIHPLA